MHKIKLLGLYAQVIIKTVNAVISRCCFAEDDTGLLVSACRTLFFFLTRILKFFICFVAVSVVDAKAPYCS